jgi:hypothetical protein
MEFAKCLECGHEQADMGNGVARAIVRSHHDKFGKSPCWGDEKYMITGRRYARVALKALGLAAKRRHLRAALKASGRE